MMRRTDLVVTDETKLKPGLYLRLFHGRNSPDDQLDDWGFDGPFIGPLESVHCTYATALRLSFVDHEDCARFFPQLHPVSGYTWGPVLQAASRLNCGGDVDPRLKFTGGNASDPNTGWNPELRKPDVRQALIDEGKVRAFDFNTEAELSLGDLIEFDGQFYGDWSMQVIGNVLPTAAQIAAGMTCEGEIHG